MYEFLLWLATFFAPVALPPTGIEAAEAITADYIGVVAAEAAYSAALPKAPTIKKLVPQADCPRCKGKGKVPSGDRQDWTKCPDCTP